MNRLFPTLLLSAALASPALAAPDVQPSRMAQDVKVLASDDFEGREPATRAEPKVIDYIVGQMKAAGLQPAGDPGPAGRAWTQAVPLARFEITGPVAVGVQANGRTLNWAQGEQVAIRAAQTGASHVTIKNAPVVFAGYGVKAPERNWDDFKGYDLKGKIVLVLVNDPDYETGVGDFGGKAMTYYGRWTYKYEEAARQGALGLIIIHETGPASYGWNTVKNSNVNAIFDIIRKDPAAAHAPLEAWIQRDAAVQLFQAAGLDFEALKKEARTRDFHPALLKGVTFSTDFAVQADRIVTRNIVGELPGTTHPDERVIYTAHWDHLGVGLPDARGDRIYNGAVDNGTGVAALLELARAFGREPRTARTVTFMSVTAEEKGLLGSEYYAQAPLYPLAKTVAVLNMDALGVNGATRDVTTAGQGALTLQDDLITVAKQHGLAFTPDPTPEAGHFFRSDHFSFAQVGVPAISFGSGEDLVKGGVAAGKAAEAAYVRDRYHQPADEYDPNWDLGGMTQDVSVLYDLGRRLADSREWPEWKPGSEFKAVRDESAAQRN
jgi:Zn-dependent M28 family amino/carboxypeptidase